jgi:single-strand DNA-binding protein
MIFKGTFGVVATGRLGKQPEVKLVGDKKSKMAKFSICAYSEQGQADKTVWLDIVAWGTFADFAEGLNKGDIVLVCGNTKTRSYTTREGVDKTASELVADFILPYPRNAFNAPNTAVATQFTQYPPPPFSELDDDDAD